MSTLLEPFGYEFFVRALIVATVSGALCGLIGVYVVLRGMSYIGHGLSHAIFGGAVASSILGVNVFLGAGAWGLAAALFINRVARRRSIGADAAIGAITSASFAIGIILISMQRSFVVNFESLLWGNVLGVEPIDVVVVLLVGIAVAAFVFVGYRPLLFSTFDPEVAEVSGVHTGARRSHARRDAHRHDRRHHERARRHDDRRHARDPAGHRAAPHRQLRPHALDLGRGRHRSAASSASTAPTTSTGPRAARSCSPPPHCSWRRSCGRASGAGTFPSPPRSTRIDVNAQTDSSILWSRVVVFQLRIVMAL